MLTLPVLSQIVLNGLNLSAIYILAALGFTLIFGIMRIINFAHGEFAMLGGFALLYLFAKLGVPYLLALPLAALVVAVASLAVEQFVYRPFYGKEMQGMIATLGLSTALTYLSVIAWGPHEESIPPAFPQIFAIGSVMLPADRLVVLIIAVVTLTAFWAFMRFTRTGLAMRVVAEDLEVAEAQGIDGRATYRISFFVATLLAALAGALFAQLYSLSPFLGVTPLLKAFIVVILGGLGSVPGAAAGGLVLGMSESFLNTFYGASIAQFASFGAIILILIFRPQGLFVGEAR